MADAEIAALVRDLGERGDAPGWAVILDSSGRQGASLEAILASHALIHTADGNLFREALASACARSGLRVERVKQRELFERVARALCASRERLERRVVELGRPLGPPWGVDQKSAAAAAWLALAGPR